MENRKGVNMAGCDYTHCDVCGCKAFYDASVDYSDFNGVQVVLCENCRKTHKIVIEPLPNDKTEREYK
jgi:hypothetical protein